MNEEQYKRIAETYAEHYGALLRGEMLGLENTMQGITISEMRVINRVRNQIKRNRRIPLYWGSIAALAACFVLVTIFFVPYMTNIITSRLTNGLTSEEASSGAFKHVPAQTFEVIPLTMQLPPGYTQVGFEQDYGESIYYIEDDYHDDVVLVLEKTSDLPDTTALIEVDMGWGTAYGTKTDAYSLLTFNADGILYTLTCRHDINTLIRLGVSLV